MTIRTFVEGDVEDTIGLGRRTHCGGMALLSAGFLAAFLHVATAKAIGLARLHSADGLQFPPQPSVLRFETGQASLELLDANVAFTAARTNRRGSGHNEPRGKLGTDMSRVFIRDALP